MPDFLLEIGCEEIPARLIEAGSLELRERVGKLLERERLAPKGAIAFLDTPRRLAVLASGIPAAQPDVTEQITGPSLTVAYKDVSRLRRHMLSLRRRESRSPNWKRRALRKANTFLRRLQRKVALPARY